MLIACQVVVPIHTRYDEVDEPPPYSQTRETSNASADATVDIQPLPDKDGIIIKVQPPKAPVDESLSHVPCDIALVIDVSGSMGADAPVPGGGERTGLSVLDLVKHACRTIISTMTVEDRLAIVTFSTESKVLQPLTVMSDANKVTARERIEVMALDGCTNLWSGLKDGIKLFNDEDNTGRVPAVTVLTDGQPNHMSPAQGYVPALKAMGNIVPSIHTFGFGYSLRSGLLKSIAEFGNGNYSFIPDAGMIGTVFVHAVANIQSTFAINAILNLTYPDYVTVQQPASASGKQQKVVQVAGGNYKLVIPLGNIQYGQSRDIYLQWTHANDDEPCPPFINAALQCSYTTGTQCISYSSRSLHDLSHTTLSDAEVAYHISRSRICAFLAELFPIDHLDEHRVDQTLQSQPGLDAKQNQLHDLITSLPASQFPKDARCSSLLQDLSGPEPIGQVSLALSRQDYFDRWGQHYLPSLHGAHARQLCNSFKDPGPLQYGAGSRLFTRCRDALSTAFDELPAPRPSKVYPPGLGFRGMRCRRASRPFSSIQMSSYNSSSGPCFAGHTGVRLAGSAGRVVPMSSLRRGARVATPRGPRRVAAVLVTPVWREVMVRLGEVLVTPWHPVAMPAADMVMGRDEGCGWVFPAQVRPREVVRYTGAIYSLLLQRDGDVGAHAIALGGGRGETPLWGVTLGHGLTSDGAGAKGSNDVRTHRFFGSYDRVARSLASLGLRRDGLVLGGGIKRSKSTGLVTGFRAFSSRGKRRAGTSASWRLRFSERRGKVVC